MSDNDDFLSFEDDTHEVAEKPTLDKWKILIVDDEQDIHKVTKLAIGNITFDGKSLELIDAMSAAEAKVILQDDSEIALALVDVVMETEHAGLDLVKYIRGELKNSFVRLILRTGQPGVAPEKDVILNYDINDYKMKTELTSDKLFTAIIGGLRSYRDAKEIERQKTELDKLRIEQMGARVEMALNVGSEDIIDVLPIPTAILNSQNQIVCANKQFLTLLKCPINSHISAISNFAEANIAFDGSWDIKALCMNANYRCDTNINIEGDEYAVEIAYVEKLTRWMVFLNNESI